MQNNENQTQHNKSWCSQICCCKKKTKNNIKIIKNNQNEHTDQDLEYNKTLDISTNSNSLYFFKLSENEVFINFEIHSYDSSGDVREMHATTELLGVFNDAYIVPQSHIVSLGESNELEFDVN
jgi:hypothetical protein